MGRATDMQGRLAALIRAGVLVLGKDARPETDGPDDGTGAARHRFHDHDPLWNFLPPRLARPLGPDQDPPLFETLPVDTGLPRALSRTRCCLFAGAADSPELRLALLRPELPLLVFEPSSRRLRELLATVGDADLARGKTFLFCGDHGRFDRPLSAYLGRGLFDLGYPVFFVQDRVAARHGQWLRGLVELVETLYFRYRIYPVEGQALRRSLPLRPMQKGLFYDQVRHLYENTPFFLTTGRIDAARGAFPGATAVCVAAGPALDGQIERIRACRDRGALVIAVNNALPPLVRQGLRPHFAVINDTSVEAGKAFADLPELPDTALVAHPLAAAGRGVFRRRLFFDTALPELFGTRTGLRLHGSVITTAFSLARHLGCARVVLAGVQLAFPCHGQGYATGTLHDATVHTPPPDPHHWPSGYPVRTFDGRPCWTTPNFLDARTWFADEIRVSGLPVVNLTPDSLLYGPGIAVDPDFLPEPEPDKWAGLAGLFPSPPPTVDPAAVRGWLDGEAGLWTTVAGAAREWRDTPRSDTARLDLARVLVERFDAAGVSYMGQRYRDFNNSAFHNLFFAGTDPVRRLDGAESYFTSLGAMAEEFLGLLAAARRELP